MSITATGGPGSSRPCASFNKVCKRLRPVEAAREAGRRFLERFATARKTRIGHKILVRIEGLFPRRGLYARGTAVRQELPALLIVLEIRDHDLIEYLFMHRRIEDG